MKKVLLIFKDGPFSKIIREILEGLGFHVFLAGNEQEGVTKLNEEKVDAVIMDVCYRGGFGPLNKVLSENHSLEAVAVSDHTEIPEYENFAEKIGCVLINTKDLLGLLKNQKLKFLS